MAKSGWADILELLFWTGIFEIVALTLLMEWQFLQILFLRQAKISVKDF